MHDLMHDLSTYVAGTECATWDFDRENIDGRIRHVSFASDLVSSGRFPTFLNKENRIRTILFPQPSWRSNMLSWDAIVLGLKVLRTLDLHNSGLKTVPNSIGKLKHLRYLDLFANGDIKSLPNSITELQYLQTMKLSFCYSFQEFPRDFNKLVNLRHLENDGCDSLTHMPSGLGKLTNLRTLNNFVLEKRLNGQFSGGLKELMKLNNLRGQLSIRNLRHGDNASIEYEAAKLNEKQNLHHLNLYWSNRSSDDDVDAWEVDDYEISLESLQPHPGLEALSLFDYWGVRLPDWLPSLTKLDTLCLRKCHKIQDLMPVTQLPFLKSLGLFKMYSLQYISNDKVDSPTPLLSTLQSLELRDLPILKGWWKDVGEEKKEEDIPPFECISKLTIRDCPQLTSNMPLYPYLQELALTDNYRLKTFQRTQQMKMMDPFSPFSQLTTLKVERMENLQSLSEVLTSLISLKYLLVGEGPKLKFLCDGIQHLTCLQELQISNCQELVDIYDDGEGNMWQALKSLRILEFSGLPRLETLPDGLQQLTSLEKLSLYRCKSLVDILQWIHNLKSLQELHIWGSDKLTSLPKEGMHQLTSLHTLTIGDCLFYGCDEDFYQLDLQSLCILEFTNLPQLEALPAFLLQLTSLQELRLHYCNSFVGIPERIFDNFRSLLQKLNIWGSHKFTSLLVEVMHQLTSLQHLSIRDCPNYDGGDGNEWQALHSLRFLHFEDLPQLETLPAGLQRVISLNKLTLDLCKSLVGIPGWIGNLKLLQDLTISECSNNLTSLPEGIRQLTSLQELYISHCLFYKGDGNMWQGLKSLRILWFSDLPQLETLSKGLQQLTSLKELRLYNSDSLVGIPKWIGNLKSLRTLTIWGCSNLTSLPEGMRQLTSLQTLSIRDCPVLKQRCEKETGGEDWHKVSHIPRLYLFGAQLQPSTSSSAARGKIFKTVRRLQLCNK
nr:putative disease resistance protein RGA1 isoform X1 [Ziziphus jujuba var. spinosa]XP_024934818.2 putative disease resistance protein RGA1 isoform X1 [Ziziphus jujuba var. spinosa]XP_024934819.2 putative disease resistance protein RGA1 isoform X1 [Ziziphus jujuba var. spinosa]XP_048330901.1 putative disease resistance protein RGA1 isoform X1 [Ziziphus jujuba var. spinosa]